MKVFGQRRVDCVAGAPTLALRSHWTNVPTQFTVSVDPPDTRGSWVERRSYVPAGIGMSNRAGGPIAAQMWFRRKYLDSSYEVEFITDRSATLTVRRS